MCEAAQSATTPADDSDVTELAKAGQDKGGKHAGLQTNSNRQRSGWDQPPSGQEDKMVERKQDNKSQWTLKSAKKVNVVKSMS